MSLCEKPFFKPRFEILNGGLCRERDATLNKVAHSFNVHPNVQKSIVLHKYYFSAWNFLLTQDFLLLMHKYNFLRHK